MGEPFDINNKQLRDINEAKEVSSLETFGGITKMVEVLKTNLETGTFLLRSMSNISHTIQGLEDDASGIAKRKEL
jgi:hypothetical protein